MIDFIPILRVTSSMDWRKVSWWRTNCLIWFVYRLCMISQIMFNFGWTVFRVTLNRNTDENYRMGEHLICVIQNISF